MNEKQIYIESCTTGNHLPAYIVYKSYLRKIFLLPWILVEYEGTNLKGNTVFKGWFRPSSIGNY